MTGTAETEETEFYQIYKLEVVGHPDEPAGPPRRPARPRLQDAAREVQRDRRGDASGCTSAAAGARRHGERRGVGDAVAHVQARGLTHNVLNAKYHQREAEIVAQAGQPAAITIATNMAGRGTDIKLGPGVKQCQVCGIRRAASRPSGRRSSTPISPRSGSRSSTVTTTACGLAHHRHRAARVAPHRSPAARPLRAPGRSGGEASSCRSRTT